MGGFSKKSAPPPPPPAAAPATAATKQIAEEAPATLDTDGARMKRRRRGKKPLVTQPAAANVGGEGASGLNIPTGN